MQIQFKEEATVFEYPSESSLNEQMVAADDNDSVSTEKDEHSRSPQTRHGSSPVPSHGSTATTSVTSVPGAPCLGNYYCYFYFLSVLYFSLISRIK